MTTTELKDRIAKAEERISKKENTIVKKTALIEKKQALIPTKDANEKYWLECEIKYLQADIERGAKEIEEIKKTIQTYQKRLAGEVENEKVENDLPEIMKKMQIELVARWDEYDIERKNRLLEQSRTLKSDMTEYRRWLSKLTLSDRELRYKSEYDIHKDNEKDARVLVIDLYRRVREITGEITDWSGITATMGTWGFTVLNGVVIGKQGRCRVESIYAGGYNIQRLHIRVLTTEIR